MAKGDIYLPTSSAEAPPRGHKSRWPLALLATILGGLVLFGGPTQTLHKAKWLVSPEEDSVSFKGSCQQAEPKLPEGYNVTEVWNHKERIINWLSGAVKIPTEIFDEMGPVDTDPRWKTIATFQDYLAAQFPLVHATLEKSVHDWGLVFEWPGSDASLKPLFLTAHQDVVPVLPSTLDQWEQPPYSGYYDGEYIWGRGASDTKSSLIGILSAIEILLEDKEKDFKPARTIILGFGSDEERGGRVGAPAIAKYLLDKYKGYGKYPFSLLIDEGSGLVNTWGQQFGVPAVAEKGHYDLAVTVETLGGHSSVPPPHTAIGYVALLLAQLEAHPHEVYLEEFSPVYGYLTCAAEFAQDIPKDLKKAVGRAKKGGKKAWEDLPKEIIKTGLTGSAAGPGQGNPIEALLKTTQAADIISGGLKVNALPESVTVVLNNRINIASNHLELEAHAVETLLPVVKHHNLTLIDFNNKTVHHGIPTSKVILSSAYGYYDDPAPISPTDATDEKSAYSVLAAVTRGIWASRSEVSSDGTIVDLKEGEDLVLAPFMTSGNTDTRRYWDLTKHIYRFRYTPSAHSFGAHTINERTNADDLIELTRWYQAIILTLDQSTSVP